MPCVELCNRTPCQFSPAHVDVEAELAETKGWFQLALWLVDNQPRVEKVLSDLPAKKQAGLTSLFGEEEIIQEITLMQSFLQYITNSLISFENTQGDVASPKGRQL